MVFYTKKKLTWMITRIEKTTLTNILRWILFLPFFFYKHIILDLNSPKHAPAKRKSDFFFSPKRKIPKNMLFPASYPWKDTSQKSPPKMGVYNMLYHLKLRINWLKRWKHSKIPFNIFIIYMCILKEMVTFTKNK